MKTQRARVKKFEVKRLKLTTYSIVHADREIKGGRLAEFIVPDDERRNDKVYNRLRDIIGGPLSWVHARAEDVDCQMVVNDNGRLIGLPLNELASGLRCEWLERHRPGISFDDLMDNSFIVGDVAIEIPLKGYAVINRTLDSVIINERIKNLTFRHPVHVSHDRVYCLYQEDATALSLALRTPKEAA